MSLVVFKLGGSLLDLPDLADVVRGAFAQRAASGRVLVVGGGATADVVRAWNQALRLSPKDAHWLAIEAMRLNESLIARLLPELRVVRSGRQVEAAIADGRSAILCADCFIRWGESQGHAPLPRSWDVTSDSIAGWVAQLLAADELVLIKSTAAPLGITVAEAAHRGLVDRYFPAITPRVPHLAWLNARSPEPRIEKWESIPGEAALRDVPIEEPSDPAE